MKKIIDKICNLFRKAESEETIVMRKTMRENVQIARNMKRSK